MGRVVRHRGAKAMPFWLTAMVTAAGCSGAGSSSPQRSVIDVYAASSLTTLLQSLEADYELAVPSVDVRLNLAGSNDLARQINAGGSAAVFLPADKSVLGLLDVAPIGVPVPLATNTLTLIVSAEARHPISSPADLATDGVLTARCAAGVPCGGATDAFLASVGIRLARSTDEADVRSVLAKVIAGEVDAGFVYLTDAQTPQADEAGVTVLPLSDAPTVAVTAALLGEDPEAVAFVHYLQGVAVADRMRAAGFTPSSNGS